MALFLLPRGRGRRAWYPASAPSRGNRVRRNLLREHVASTSGPAIPGKSPPVAYVVPPSGGLPRGNRVVRGPGQSELHRRLIVGMPQEQLRCRAPTLTTNPGLRTFHNITSRGFHWKTRVDTTHCCARIRNSMRLLTMIALGASLVCQLRGDEGSARFLSDRQLEALGEKRLDNAKPDKSIIRITVLPSLEAPILIKWLIQEPGKQSEVIIRRPKLEVSEDGAAVYKGLEVDKRAILSKGHTLALHHAMHHAKVDEAPADDWKPPVPDGSGWIIEYSSPGDYRLLKRSNLPDDPDFLLLDDIPKTRLLREAKLSEFCMLLWSLAGVDDLLYFRNNQAQQGGAGQAATQSRQAKESVIAYQWSARPRRSYRRCLGSGGGNAVDEWREKPRR